MTIFRFSSFDEENAQFCCEHIAGQVENTLEWEREMVIKRQQKVWYSYSSLISQRAFSQPALRYELFFACNKFLAVSKARCLKVCEGSGTNDHY